MLTTYTCRECSYTAHHLDKILRHIKEEHDGAIGLGPNPPTNLVDPEEAPEATAVDSGSK